MRQLLKITMLAMLGTSAMVANGIESRVQLIPAATGKVCDDMPSRVQSALKAGKLTEQQTRHLLPKSEWPATIKELPTCFAVSDDYNVTKSPLRDPASGGDEGEDPLAIDCNLNISWDAEKYSPSVLLLFNKDEGYKYYIDELTAPEGSKVGIKVRPGVYDVYVSFWCTESYNGLHSQVIMENVQVPQAGEIAIGSDLIDTRLKVNGVWPDGEPMVVPYIKILDEEPWGEVISEGNVEGTAGYAVLYHEDYGRISEMTISGGAYYSYDSDDPDARWDVYDYIGNSLSSKYKWITHRVAGKIGSEVPVYLMQSCEVVQNGELVNSATDYVTLTDNLLGHTPAYDPDNASGLYGKAEITIAEDNELDAGLEAVLKNPACEIMVCADTDKFDFEKYGVVYRLLINELVEKKVVDYGDGNTEEFYVCYTMEGAPFMLHNGEKHYTYYPRISPACVTSTVNREEYPKFWNADAVYRFAEDDVKVLAGESSPYMTFANNVSKVESDRDPGKVLNYNFLYHGWEGILGEQRIIDQQNQKVEFYQDGELVKEAQTDVLEWGREWRDTDHEPCELEYRYENRNFEHDGIAGLNRTVITSHWGQEDCVAPSLHFMSLREKKTGAINDKFERADEGELIFAGGDFNSFDDGRWYYVCEPMNVKVECAPTGTSDWQELTATEEPEKVDVSRGFGHFYRVALGDVNKGNGNGWYDVRFTLTDLSGNKQEQLISPLFKIGGGSGVSDIVDEDPAASVQYFTLTGIRVGNPDAKGIYIERRGKRAVKKVVR